MTLVINLPPPLEAKLAQDAKTRGMDTADLVMLMAAQNYPDGDPYTDKAHEIYEIEGEGDFGGRSVYEVFHDVIGTVRGGPTDMAAHPENYLAGFGEMEKTVRAEALCCVIPGLSLALLLHTMPITRAALRY